MANTTQAKLWTAARTAVKAAIHTSTKRQTSAAVQRFVPLLYQSSHSFERNTDYHRGTTRPKSLSD